MQVIKLLSNEVEQVVDRVVQSQEGLLSHVNVPHVSKAWSQLIERRMGVAFAALDPEPVGFLLALYSPDAITGELFAIQYLWMVSPKSRKSGAALELLRTFEEEGKLRGCVRILTGANQVHKPDAMRRLFRRLGYAPFSEAFSKEIK